MKKLLLLLSLFPLHWGAFAQQTESADPEFETDRPTFTQSPSVVPRAFYQQETGFQYQKQRQGGTENKEWLYPQGLLRVGILKFAELRLEATYRREDSRTEENILQQEKGLSTVRVGTKVHLAEAQGALPEMSLLAMLELPWGAAAFAPHKVAPEVMLLFSNELTDKLTLQYNAGFQRQMGDASLENQLQYSATFSEKVSEKLTLAAEFFGEKPKGSHAENQIDGSIQYLVLPNLQLDAIIGTDVSAHAHDMFVGGGISLRLPR